MMRSDLDRTRAVRAWLADGSTELSPRVFDNVLREVPATSQDRPHWASPRLAMSTVLLSAAAVVLLAVVVIGAGLFGGMTPGGPAETPRATPPASRDALSPTPVPIDYSYRDVGFIGLPPLDAVPSDPTLTELVETFWRSRMPYTGQSFLYADGRLIWVEYLDSQTRSTGWLQQTVTPDGIELVRELATTNNRQPLFRFLDPAELPWRLPADAWVDRTVRPYVPSGFGVCIFVSNIDYPFTESPMTLPEKLAAIPPAVAAILGDHQHVPSPNAYDADDGEPSDCLGMDVPDARLLNAALREAGLEQDEGRNSFLLEYHLTLDRPGPGTWWLSIWFEPILPHGTITCSGCG